MMKIGTVARAVGVNAQTLRFYERQGLIDSPPRTSSGYRQYPDDYVHRLRFIIKAKKLGFSLKEIEVLLSLKVDPKSNCGDVKEKAMNKISDIESKLVTLKRMKRVLIKLAERCDSNNTTEDCPILESLKG